MTVRWIIRCLSTLLGAALIAGCAAADKSDSGSGSSSGSDAGTQSSSSYSSGSMSSSGSMAGMNMSGGSSMSGAAAAKSETAAAVKSGSAAGIKPIPMRVLGTATWQGMKITAEQMTAVPFVIYNGTTERMVKPTNKTSFHLMVMLNDAHTGVTIPYAGVWATITKAGEVVYDERQWPMISEYMGPHYGNDVTLPGSGSYHLSLLVSPPVSARHVEYEHVWLKPHRVSMTFTWSAPA